MPADTEGIAQRFRTIRLGGTSNLPDGALSSTPAGKHTWGSFGGNGIGNETYIDTYVYGLTSSASTITAIKNDDALLIGVNGIVTAPDYPIIGEDFLITVTDADLDTNALVQESQFIVVNNPRTGEVEQLSLLETGVSASVFSSAFTTVADSNAGTNNDGSMNVITGDVLTLTYFDQLDDTGASVDRVKTIEITLDGDSVPEVSDIDNDNDGIPDSDEGDGAVDTDGDGIPDSLDVDSDNDGIYDLHESGANAAVLDLDDDGRIDPVNVVGANGLADAVETVVDSGVISYNSGVPLNTDGDSVADFRDRDSDNDGLTDTLEAGGADTNGDGVLDGFNDSNGDGLDDATAITPLVRPDTDSDGAFDFVDLDSDNDSLTDTLEAGGADTSGDGVLDGFADGNGDGLDDATAATPLANADNDLDGVSDRLDFDSDNDGLTDVVEAGGTDANGDGVIDGFADGNGDGLDDATATTPLANADNDADTLPNYLDTDSDGDGVFDLVEAGASDVDNDGRVDSFADANLDGLDDALFTTPLIYVDTDADGIVNAIDLDADNDGIPDIVEMGASPANPQDSDVDGVPDHLDLDSDNDGLTDTLEAGGADTNGDGVLDGFADGNGDGLDDAAAVTPLANADNDGDGVVNVLDLDSDNDGLTDILEAGGTDTNKDGVLDSIVDNNNDGLDDATTATPLTNADSDGDTVPNYLDVDADNDGITDIAENGRSDADGNGVIDGFIDTNGDGLDDIVAMTKPDVIDSDFDGVANLLDVDSDNDGVPDVIEAGGIDADYDGTVDGFADGNGDGLDDATATTPLARPDTDADDAFDFVDLDSDNDGLTDTLEAGVTDANYDGMKDDLDALLQMPLPDTDSDLVADYLDTDSDNDGIFDIANTAGAVFDLNGDGMVDNVTDSDGDGIPDVIDADGGVFGSNDDLDSDGVPTGLDKDDDNDGVPNMAETDAGGNDIDTDGDGLVDRLDRDSDNDGIPDSIEAVGSTELDANRDGVVDNFVDTNNDGLLDTVDEYMSPINTDGSGEADIRDLDSDEDGLFDLFEASGLSNTYDVNNDGMVDSTIDADIDGLVDTLDPVTGTATVGVALVIEDTDGDGYANYADADSDNDGYSDLIENGDFNGDGTIDSLQYGEGLETAVTGVGAYGPLSLLWFTLVLVLRRKAVMRLLFIVPTLVMVPFQVSAANEDINYCGRHDPLGSDEREDFRKCFYIGAGLLASHVSPEGSAGGWSTSDDSDSGYSLMAGWHFAPHWFGELTYSDLGEAGLTNVNPLITGEEKISYKVPSFHVGYFLREPEQRLNFYGKVGISAIANEATTPQVPYEQQSNVQISGGLGVQWRSEDKGWFARLFLDLHDRDAKALGVMLGYYLGKPG